jgi:hypothetical protein
MGLAVGGEDRPSARGKPLSLDEHRMTGKVKLEGLRPPANVRPKRADLDSGEGRGI